MNLRQGDPCVNSSTDPPPTVVDLLESLVAVLDRPDGGSVAGAEIAVAHVTAKRALDVARFAVTDDATDINRALAEADKYAEEVWELRAKYIVLDDRLSRSHTYAQRLLDLCTGLSAMIDPWDLGGDDVPGEHVITGARAIASELRELARRNWSLVRRADEVTP